MRNSNQYKSLPFNPGLRKRAKELRKAGYLCEVLLWQQLSNRKFKQYDFDRQKIIGNYIVDFFCGNCNAVIEIDGITHDFKAEYDAKRDRYLKGLGLKVIHIAAEDVLNRLDAVMSMLEDHPVFRGDHPGAARHPSEGGECHPSGGGE